MDLQSRPLFRATIEVGPVASLGPTPGRDRRVIDIRGGRIEGARVAGAILPGGADWQTLWPDGLAEIEARYVLETVDGARVLIHSSGTRHGPAEAMANLAAGRPVDPSAYYFRTALRFETGHPAYAWLTRLIAVGVGARRPERVELDVHEVL